MSVDDLIRDRLDALVEPLDDPAAVVAAIEGRRRGAPRRGRWPVPATAAAITVLAAVGGVMWLRGEPDREVVAGPDTTSGATSPAPERGLPDCSRDEGFEPLPLPGAEGDPTLSAPDPDALRDAVWARAALAVPQLASDPDPEPVLDGCGVRSDAGGGAHIGISGDEASGYALTHLRYPASDDRSMGVRIQGERAEVSVPAGCGGCVAELAVSYGGEVATATAPAGAGSVTVTVTRSMDDPGAVLRTLRDDTGDVVSVDGVQVPPGDFAAS
ncbi:MAG TPA: hypothetical protein VKZ55_10820 [Microthrixaceae bacterium]|nr:hypothetical protein [Microthrixaceae bacterium]